MIYPFTLLVLTTLVLGHIYLYYYIRFHMLNPHTSITLIRAIFYSMNYTAESHARFAVHFLLTVIRVVKKP